MDSNILNIYKPAGLTPVQLINQLKNRFPEYRNRKISFAGRLDPLASGVLLLLLDQENKSRDKYLSLDKTYQFRVLLGVETDSYDYLGLLKEKQLQKSPLNWEEKAQKFTQDHLGELTLPYPPFSSKPLNGVPLYKLAKTGQLNGQKLPTKKVLIKEFKQISVEKMNWSDLKKTIFKNLNKVTGHFRQTKTKALWREFFSLNSSGEFTLITFQISCSTGTYVRTLAHLLGQELGCGAIAFEIIRLKVGNYKIEDSFRLEST